ncbi:MAG: M48 family metallopeptidase [Myxococcales bacterium]
MSAPAVPSAIARYLAGYPPHLLEQAAGLLAQGRLGEMLARKYPLGHEVRTDRALYDYAVELKQRFLRNAEPLSKVVYDNKLKVVGQALGTHTTASRVQGGRLKAKREIRIASLFKDTPAAFLKMIVVHELAHLKERGHDKAFYQLCTHMEPDYHQLEFDLRLHLVLLDSQPQPVSAPMTSPPDLG